MKVSTKSTLIATCTLAAVCAVLGAAFALGPSVSVPSTMNEQSPDLRDAYRRTQEIVFPDDNPYTSEKHKLGKTLFFDPILSGSRSTSCASCHNPDLAWGDGRSRAIGEGRVPLGLRAPTLLDVGSVQPLGWDGKFKDLESVPYGPILNPTNMNLSEAELNKRLAGDQAYVQLFAAAFTDGINRRNVEMALATFVRTIVSGTAPFDRWIDGDENAINAAAKRGFAIFNGKAQCSACHSGPSFTDGSFHDIGVANGDDIGRGKFFPTSKMLRYAFKTPTLRDVDRRAPYMHDGSVATLEAVIDLYDRGGIDRPSRSREIKLLSLTDVEKSDLIAFIKTLTASPTTKAQTQLENDPAAERHALMMANGKYQYGVLGRMRRGVIPYEQEAVNLALSQLEETARKLPTLFPEPPNGSRSTLASPKIWQNKADFLAHVGALSAAVQEAKAGFKDLKSLKAGYPALNDTCNSCHEAYRVSDYQ